MALEELIKQGEGARLEFKSTLQWDILQGAKNESLRKSVLKTIAAFLNTEGGTLIIGVEDDGSVYGLEADLALVNKSRDKFAQLVGTLLIEQLGAAYAAPPLVSARFDEIGGKTVYVVEVQPSSEPVFLKDEKGKKLYIRVQTTTRDLDAKDTVEYIKTHWGESDKKKKATTAQEGETNFMTRAFHTIAIPHDDILQGRLTMDVFAANLWETYNNRGSEEYRLPQVFFQKTYLTEGLRFLLDVVQARLEGRGGDPVIQIQTPFGGGKTHTQIAMYHRASDWNARRVVLVGSVLGPHDTLWGELEKQLTGKKQYFTEQVSPGRGDVLRNLLAENQPLLILMDEVLEYVTKAAGVKVEESTLAAQTMAFMQELTEVVSTLEKVCLVITLPSSLLEHYDSSSEQLFQQLQRVAGRVEKIYTPVQEYEIAQVIRRRLFSHIDEKSVKTVVSGFMEYAQVESLLPAGMEASEYRNRFEASYPFLPEVIDVLYHRWGSFINFQRTRGVLRLLALVINDLKNSTLPYISLADFNLSNQEIRQELLKHIGQEFDSVIAADITGADSGAKKVSQSLGKAYQGLRLGERVATSIFMYSFSGGVERGATLGEIKRAVAKPENPSSAVAEAVEAQKDKLFYLQQQSGKYFFTNQPNLNRVLLMRMENIQDEEIREMEMQTLRSGLKGARIKPYIWPADGTGIPDTPEFKLVILRERNDQLLKSMLTEKGSTPRVHRNTLFFLVPMSSERVGFESLVRKVLAFHILEGDSTLALNAEQRREIKDNLRRLESDLSEAIRRLYRLVILPAREGWREQDLGIPTYGETKSLDEEIYDKLRLEGEILERIAPLFIKEKYLQGRDWVLTEQLYQSGMKTPGEVRAINASVWEAGIAEGVRKGMFGLGELIEEKPVCRYFNEEPSISLSGSEVLIRAEVCQEQRAEQTRQPVYHPGNEALPLSNNIQEVGPAATAIGGGDSLAFPDFVSTQGAFTQLMLNFELPKGKVSSLMGILNFLQSRYNRMRITLNVEQGNLSEQEFEEKIREAFRQIGVEIEEGRG